MNQSTSFAQVATNLLNVLQGYTKGIRFVAVLTMLLTVGIGQAWGAVTTYTFNSKSWGDSSIGWTSGKDGNQFTSDQGVQVTTGVTGANATTKNSFTNISSIAVQYCTNASKGVGSIKIQVGSNTQKSFSVTKPSSNGTTLKTATFTFDPNETGKVKITVDCTTNSVYIYSVAITTADAVTCTTPPTVSAGSNSNITSTTATVSCSGGITSLGSTGCSITSYGFVYGTSTNPTTSNTIVQVGTTYTKTGTDFSKELTDLTANTTYYVRPYATNGNGTAYGTQTSFKTLELPKYTVTLNAGPGTCAAFVTETSAGAGVELPEPTLDCDDWKFAGWATSSVANETTAAPTTLLDEGSNYKPTGDCTLYAVYKRTEEGSGGGSVETTKVFSGANNADLKFTAGSSSNHLVNDTGYTAGDANVKFTTGTNNNNSYYDGSVVRFYAGSSLIVTPLNDVTITHVEFVRSTSTSSNGGAISTEQLTASTNNTTTNTNVFTGSATSAVTFKNSAQCRFSVLRITYTSGSGTTTTTYYHSNPDCGDPCDALQAPNVMATATANSITLSWAAVDGATSYNIYNYTTEDLDETTSLTYTFTGLSSETEYEWGVESAKDECLKETRGTTTTQKACTDAVTISKGTETNGIFTLSTTGQHSTCDGPVTVTLSNIQPATGYQFSEITQSGVDAAKVTIDNTAKTVTYAKNTTGTSTINVTFTPKEYTLSLESSLSCVTNGSVTFSYNATSAKTFSAATRNDYTCIGYWSAPSGGVQVLKTDGTFVGENVNDFITDGKWINTTATKLTPRWETEYKMILSKGTEENGTYTLSTTNIETSGCATSTTSQVTITATPDAGYEVDQITYNGDGTASIISGPTLNTGKTTWVYAFEKNDKGEGTFIVTFKSLPQYTITWLANGHVHRVQTDIEGTAIEIPMEPKATTYACEDKVFVGWVGAPIDGSIDIEPTFITDFGNVEEDKTYYAVFATPSGDGFTLGQSGDFTIYANVNGTNYYATGDIGDNSKNGKISSTTTESDANRYTFTAKSSDSKTYPYTIQRDSKYIKYSSSTDLATQDDSYTWTISKGTKGSWRVTSGTEGRAFVFRAGSSNLFGGYATSNITANGIEYYDIEIGGATTYTEYVTSCVTCENVLTISKGNEENGTFTLDKVGEQETCDGLSVLVTPTPAEHYHVASVSASTGETAVNNGDGTYTITYVANSTGESTIHVVFEEDTNYEVTWSVNGKSLTEAELNGASTIVYEGYRISKTPPAPNPDDFCGQVFVGWTDAEMDVNNTSKPTIYNQVDEFPTANADQNFYAVFADYVIE